MGSVDTVALQTNERGRKVWVRVPAGTPAPKGARYRARWRAPNGGSRQQTFDRKLDADRHIAKMTVDTAAGDYVDPSAGRATFGTVAAAWADAQPHRASTVEVVDSFLRNHILPTFRDRPIASIRTSEVQAWVTGLDLAPSTAGEVYGKVKAIFAMAVDDRIIGRTPCTKGVKLPRGDGSEISPMSHEEVFAVIDAVNERYRALIVLLAGSGLRPGEALGLTVDRVNWLRLTLRVDRQLITRAGVPPYFGPPKTTSSVRTVPVPRSVIDELARHLERWGAGPDGLLFTNTEGQPIRRSALGHMWRRSVAALNDAAGPAGVRVVDRTPHDLRHYAASVLIDQGCSPKAVQKHLGHASASTTLDTYGHLWPDNEDDRRRALDAGLRRGGRRRVASSRRTVVSADRVRVVFQRRA